jgi:hypothetical protein
VAEKHASHILGLPFTQKYVHETLDNPGTVNPDGNVKNVLYS